MLFKTLLLQILISHGFTVEQAKVMSCIAYHESTYNRNAIHLNDNGTSDYGLMQVNSIWLQDCHLNKSKILNINKNIDCAKKIFDKQGFKAWSTYKYCRGNNV